MTDNADLPKRGPSLESVRHCLQHYAGGTEDQCGDTIVVDVGGGNGAWRAVFEKPPFQYRIVDPARVASKASAALYRLPLGDGSADIVLASRSADHADFVWHMFNEMLRVLRPGGCIFLSLPFAGLLHRYPTDRYRFFPDPCAALADFAGCTLVAGWTDDHRPWRDRVGVFRRADAPPAAHPPPAPLVAAAPHANPQGWNGQPGSAEEEATKGAIPYLTMLDRLQAELAPTHYLEIGVRSGSSLALARARATGIDPAPILDVALPATTEIVRLTSDAYFANDPIRVHPDLGFIDGMHLFEYALRDFMNIERCAAPGAVALIDDIFPNHPSQAERDRRTQVWTGDVWRFAEILRSHRPDLFLLPIDTSPTGLLLVAGLDPANRVLWDSYESITRTALDTPLPPPAVMAREGALAPASPALDRFIQVLKAARIEHCPPREIVARLRQVSTSETVPASPIHAGAPEEFPPKDAPPAVSLPNDALPTAASPKISFIVIGYNMQRELPRTIRSLSPAMQRDIDARDYEVILIDNGSTQMADPRQLRDLLPGLAMYRMQTPTVSPVPAINFGLSVARGDLVGVCIDGARMVSPGLLSMALSASRLHQRPVIGTIGFHLGPAVQSESIRNGYNEAVEDDLLARCGWEADGYRLFSIASLASSSSRGWFALPTESNAVFLRAEHWRALGGWDNAFATPGGGLANHDTWARACADPSGCVIMLLGEATFHQVHGGVATNNLNPPLQVFHDEYARLRGHPFRPPTRQPMYFGTLPDAVRRGRNS